MLNSKPNDSSPKCRAISVAQDVLLALLPALLELCRDPVAAVRLAAGSQLGSAAASLCQGAAPSDETPAVSSIALAAADVCLLARSPAFQHRQVYALAFEGMAGAMPADTVLHHFWPAFASLAADPVSNVRLAVARMLVSLTHVPMTEEVTDSSLPSGEAAADFATQLPVRELALELGGDSDHEVARLAREGSLALDNMQESRT